MCQVEIFPEAIVHDFLDAVDKGGCRNLVLMEGLLELEVYLSETQDRRLPVLGVIEAMYTDLELIDRVRARVEHHEDHEDHEARIANALVQQYCETARTAAREQG